MTDDWPSYAEELTRKTVQQLEKWTEFYDQGRLPAPVFTVILSTLYDTTSGLIEKRVSDLIADMHRDVRAQTKSSRAT